MVADRPNRPNRPTRTDRPDGADGFVGVGFEVVRRGYDPGAVEAYLRRLDTEVQILGVDRDAAVEQSRQLSVELEACWARVERLRGQVSALSRPTLPVATASERIRSMLRLVEDDITELRNRVAAEWPDHAADDRVARMVEILVGACAESMRAAARAAATAVEAERDRVAAELETARRDDAARNTAAMAAVEAERGRVLAELETERGRVVAELETARRVNAEQIKQATAAAEAERAQAWADSKAQCAQVERDFQLAMDSRRSEALSLLASQREQTRRMNEELRAGAARQAHRTIEDARTTTRQILEQGERQNVLLRAQRQRLITQLNAAHQELDRTLSGLVPPPDPAQI